MNKLLIAAAFVAGQFWAYGLGGALAPSATAQPMASAPQCVTEVAEPKAPDVRELVKLMPLYVRAGTGADTPPTPREKPDQIAALIGGVK